MRVLVVSGIWPPDVGGPASHAPEVAAFLAGRGHRVEVVTTADAPPAAEAYPVRFVPRRLPPGARHARGVELIGASVQKAIARGVSVYQGNLESALEDYPDGAFDYVILSQTL